MNSAWEVTIDDVLTVLNAHCIVADVHGVEQLHDDLDQDRVIDAVMSYTDFDDQTNAALSEIEDQLIEAKIVSLEKKFASP